MKKRTTKKAKPPARRRPRSAAKDLTAKRTGAVKAGTLMVATKQVPVLPRAFGTTSSPPVHSITDGTSNTIMS